MISRDGMQGRKAARATAQASACVPDARGTDYCDVALRAVNAVAFSQDADLRYIAVNGRLFGHDPARVIGAQESDLLPAHIAERTTALKREVLESGEARETDLRLDGRPLPCWVSLRMEAVRNEANEITGVCGAVTDVTGQRDAERHLRLLMRELTHRSKNLLAVIQAMARQSARGAGDIDEFLTRFTARLQAVARSHDLLVEESWHGADLHELAGAQLDQYLDRGEGSQIDLHGPGVRLKPEAAQSVGLALHELATNSAKYGALSSACGHVDLGWDWHEDDGSIALHWTESGGPTVSPPKRRGFGSLVIEKNLSRALEADVALEFPPEGVAFRVVLPAEHLLPENTTGTRIGPAR